MIKRLLAAVLSVVMILSFGLSITSCKGTTDDPNQTPGPTPNGPALYTVTITTEYGLALSGLSFIIHDEASTSPNSSVARITTDRDGRASAELDSSKTYSVKILYPEVGFLPEEKYLFNSDNHAEVRIKTAPIDGEIEDFEGYSLGDVVKNYKFTDINGVERSVSEALSENDLLILNFWYVGCGPCREEFPTIISAYEKHSQSGVEIFAINDNGDAIGTIRDYRISYNGQSVALPFPTIKPDGSGGYRRCELISAFGGSAYPYSVFIDRAGMICYIYDGKIPSMTLERLIEHFTSEYYVARIGSDIFN